MILNTQEVINSVKEIKENLESELNNSIEEIKKVEERRVMTLLIPMERLNAARRDLEKFLSGWDKEKLDKLRTSQQLKNYRMISRSIQWTGRVTSVVGGSLLFVGANEENQKNPYTQAGGIIAIVAPFTEIVTSQWEKNYESDKKKWEEFVKDAESILYTYRDLEQIVLNINENYIFGEAKEIFKDLKNNIEEFAKEYEEYDINKDGKIDEEEWEKAKDKFSQDLKDNWEVGKDKLRKIKKMTEKLWKEVSNYRESDKLKQMTIDINDEQQSQIQILPK